MELTDLPDDKLFELCERLDTRTLASMVRSNTKIRNLCQVILDQRKIAADLVNRLKGEYVKLKYEKGGFQRMRLKITKFTDNIYFDSEEPIIEGMTGQRKLFLHGYHIFIPIDDIRKLQKLEENLTELGYIKLGKPFGYLQFDHIFIEDFPDLYREKSSRYLQNMTTSELIRTLKELGIQITEERSDEELRMLLVEELRNQGRFSEP